MTRRDKDTKNASVIAGLRLEPTLAVKLTDYSLYLRPAGEGKGDVAAAARRAMRMGSGTPADIAEHEELHLRPIGNLIRGLRLDERLAAIINETARRYELGPAGAARHLLRMSLGWTMDASLEAERTYSAIAAARREIYEGLKP